MYDRRARHGPKKGGMECDKVCSKVVDEHDPTIEWTCATHDRFIHVNDALRVIVREEVIYRRREVALAVICRHRSAARQYLSSDEV